MEFFAIILKQFWIACILVTFVNGIIFHFRSRKRVKENPELTDGYRKIIKGFVLWGNIPWVVMGIGCTIGGIPSVFHFFNPKDVNPYVLAFFGSVVFIWAMGTYWLFLRGGAQMLVQHPGLLNYDIKSPTVVKLIWIACILGGIAGVLVMYTQNIPLPKM